MKEKALFVLNLIEWLDSMNIYIPDIADEEGLEIDYDDVHNIVKTLKKCIEINEYFKD